MNRRMREDEKQDEPIEGFLKLFKILIRHLGSLRAAEKRISTWYGRKEGKREAHLDVDELATVSLLNVLVLAVQLLVLLLLVVAHRTNFSTKACLLQIGQTRVVSTAPDRQKERRGKETHLCLRLGLLLPLRRVLHLKPPIRLPRRVLIKRLNLRLDFLQRLTLPPQPQVVLVVTKDGFRVGERVVLLCDLGGEVCDTLLRVEDDGVVLLELFLALLQFGVAAASFVAATGRASQLTKEEGRRGRETYLLISRLLRSSCSVLLL